VRLRFAGCVVPGLGHGRILAASYLDGDISKISSGGLAQALRLMFFANLLKCWHRGFQDHCDIAFVFDIEAGNWPAVRRSKNPYGELNPFQSVAGAHDRVQNPRYDRSRHSCERLTKGLLQFLVIGHFHDTAVFALASLGLVVPRNTSSLGRTARRAVADLNPATALTRTFDHQKVIATMRPNG
jgi:hypothetical protein